MTKELHICIYLLFSFLDSTSFCLQLTLQRPRSAGDTLCDLSLFWTRTEGARSDYLLLTVVWWSEDWNVGRSTQPLHDATSCGRSEKKNKVGESTGLTSFHGVQLNQNRNPIPRHQRLYFLIAPARGWNMDKPDWPRPPSHLKSIFLHRRLFFLDVSAHRIKQVIKKANAGSNGPCRSYSFLKSHSRSTVLAEVLVTPLKRPRLDFVRLKFIKCKYWSYMSSLLWLVVLLWS